MMNFFRKALRVPIRRKIDPAKISARIADEQFRDLPDGHRTTFVAAMIDMLVHMSRYLDDDTHAAFEPLLSLQTSYSSGDLREQFDKYLSDHMSARRYSVGSSFLCMLMEKAGVSESELGPHLVAE